MLKVLEIRMLVVVVGFSVVSVCCMVVLFMFDMKCMWKCVLFIGCSVLVIRCGLRFDLLMLMLMILVMLVCFSVVISLFICVCICVVVVKVLFVMGVLLRLLCSVVCSVVWFLVMLIVLLWNRCWRLLVILFLVVRFSNVFNVVWLIFCCVKLMYNGFICSFNVCVCFGLVVSSDGMLVLCRCWVWE